MPETRTQYQAIVEPDAQLSDVSALWSAETSITEQSPVAGRVVATGATSAVLRASGPQTGGLSLRCAQGGHPTGRLSGGTLIARQSTTAGPDWLGWEAPATVSGVTAPNWGASDPVQTLHAAGLPDGSVVIAGCGGSTPTDGGTLWVWRWGPGASSWTRVTVWDSAATGRDAYAPCLVPAVDRLLLFAFVESPVTGAGAARRVAISAWESVDGGATWTLRGEGLSGETDMRLGGSFTGSTTERSVRRLRGAYLAGQVLLVAHLVNLEIDGTYDRVDVLRQWASDDLGQTLVRVTTWSGSSADEQDGGYHEVVAVGGVFGVYYLRATLDRVSWRRIGAAGVPLQYGLSGSTNSALAPVWDDDTVVTTAQTVGPNTAQQITAGDLAIAVDETLIPWMVLRKADAGGSVQNQLVIAYADPSGTAWTPYGRNGASFATESDAGRVAPSIDSGNSSLRNVALASTTGRLVLACQPSVDTATSTEDALLALWLGGFSTLTMPPIADATRTQDRGTWDQTWLPIERPDDVSGWTATSSGTSSATLATSGAPRLALSTTGVGTRYYQQTAGYINQTHMIAEWVCQVTAGGSYATAEVAFEVQIATASQSRVVSVRLDPTGYRVYDVVAAATLYTVTGLSSSEVRQYRLALDRASGAVRVWHRTYTPGADARTWTTDAGSYTAADGGALGGGLIVRWGHVASPALAATVTSDWGLVQWAFGSETSATAEYGNAGSRALWHSLTSQTLLRDALWGRPVGGPGTRAYLTRLTWVTAQDGPLRRSEEWTITPTGAYSVQRVFPAQNRSPRRGWRSTGVGSAVQVAVQYPGGGDRELLSGFLGIVLRGCNWRTGAIALRSAGAWSTVATLDLAVGRTSLPFQRYGRSLVPNGASSAYFVAHELAGWTVDLGSGTGRYQRVVSNREGTWTNGTPAAPTCQLVTDRDGSLLPLTGNLSLWAPDVAILIPSPGRFSGVRLTIDAQSTADGDLRLGQMLVGPVHVLPRQPSWGTSRTVDLGYEITRDSAGVATLARPQPAARTVEIAWTDGVEQTGAWSGVGPPDYLTPYTSGTPMSPGAMGATPFLLDGVLRRANGLPLAYLPRVAPFAGSVQVLTRREELIVGSVDGPLVVENVIGDELRDEVVRVAKIAIREEV